MFKKNKEASVISSQQDGTRTRPARNTVCRDSNIKESMNV